MSKRKILIITISILIIISTLLGVTGLYNYLRVKYAKIEVVLTDNLTLEFDEEKKVSDFIKSINGKITNDKIIDSHKLGRKEVTVEFINDDNIPVKYKFDVTIIDTVSPYIRLSSVYSKIINSEDDLLEKIICVDNADETPNCYIDGNYDLTKKGDYPLRFIAEDESGNKTEKTFTLNVYEPSKTNNSSKPTYTYFKDVKEHHKKDNTSIGLDLSTWQGNVDFKKLKDEGVEFVILRVGSTKKDGEYFLDDEFIRNITEANKLGIPVGVYFYSYATSPKEAKENAEWVINQIKNYKVDLPIAFDWENWTNFNSYHLSLYKLNELANTFIETLEASNYKGMLYASKSYLEDMWQTEDKTIWVAQYLSDYKDTTSYKGNYYIWQMCSDGIIEGINGYVDINIMYKDGEK